MTDRETCRRSGPNVYITCGACGGCGEVFAERLTQVYRLVPRAGHWVTTTDIASKLELSPENTANMLRRLLRAGIIRRRGAGSRTPYEWSSMEPGLMRAVDIIEELRNDD